MISVNDISFEYEKDKKALKGLSFDIKKGESVGLIGANGAGKSTLLKALVGVIFTSGEILIDGVKVTKSSLGRIRKSIGFVLQNSDNQMFMPTVYEDIIFGPLNYGHSREEAEKKADEVLNMLGISDLKHRHNHKISTGEKRMAAIATILALEPEAIIMDEPTSALDPFNRRGIINTIKSLDKTKLIASHDLDMIYETCSRVILISGGEIVADGDAEEILRNRQLLEDNRLELPLSLAR